MPGTVSACVVSSPIPTQTPANPFGVTSTTAPTALSSAALLPIVYWYGHSDVKRNQPVMEKSIQNLAKAVKERMSLDAISWCLWHVVSLFTEVRIPFQPITQVYSSTPPLHSRRPLGLVPICATPSLRSALRNSMVRDVRHYLDHASN